jgi:hypothetical protein
VVENFHQHYRYVFPGADLVKIIEYNSRTMAAGSADPEAERQTEETLRLSRSSWAGDALSGRNRLCLTERVMENAAVIV